MFRQTDAVPYIKSLFEQLKQFSSVDPMQGITRLAYSAMDEKAHHFMIAKMKDAGLLVRQDAAGNVFARLAGKQRELSAIGTGSHLDSVPHGGAYDGVIGVLAGLSALLQFKSGELKRDVELVVFRAEESSRFGFSCIGSKVLAGKVDYLIWQQQADENGHNVFDAMDQAGYSSQKLALCELPSDYFAAFVELHIEQGKQLEQAEKTIGIVTGISAPTRYAVLVTGHADHSGATPMNQRHDALLASACIIEALNHAACEELAWGTVGTVGKLDVQPNSINVIPGEVRFYVDIRGVDADSVGRVVNRLKHSATEIAIVHGVEVALQEISTETPVTLSDDIGNIIARHCEEDEISYLRMISGAGHDSMYMASKCPTAMIFTPSQDGISHHPDEYTRFTDIAIAADLLKATMKTLANQ